MNNFSVSLQTFSDYINIQTFSDSDKAKLSSIFTECDKLEKNDNNLTGIEINKFLEIVQTTLSSVYDSIKNFFSKSEEIFNMQLGQDLIEQYNTKNPNVKSSTYLGAMSRYLERTEGSSEQSKNMLKEAELLGDEPSEINQPCYSRAIAIANILKESNYKGNSAIIHTFGDRNDNTGYCFGSHVFNVIGLDKNANISDPSTWGKNAVIVDAWAGKTMTPKEAIEFYRDFFNYNNEHQKSNFEQLD